MSSDSDQRKRAQRPPSAPSYDVGFGKPPVRSRFEPGQSGNPRGRPKGSRNRPPSPALQAEGLRAIVRKEAYRMVPINDAHGTTTIPIAQAVVRSLAVNAAKGSQRAQRLFTELLSTTEREDRREREAELGVALDYKIAWERELERRRTLGITGPEPLPHPDHIEIDLQTGTVHIRGPATKQEKAAWARWDERRAQSRTSRIPLRDRSYLLRSYSSAMGGLRQRRSATPASCWRCSYPRRRPR